MTDTPKPKGRGGRRPGSGRKKLAEPLTSTVAFSVTARERDAIAQAKVEHGKGWVRSVVLAALESIDL